MYQQAYEGGSLLWLPTFALILFMSTFAIVVIRSWLKGKNDPNHARMASLPLEDDVRPVDSQGGPNV